MLHSQRDPKTPFLQSLPEWLELDYHTRPRPLQRARFWVSLTAIGVTGILALCTFWPRMHWVHQSGPVAPAHAMWADQCEACHTTPWQPLARLVEGDSVRSTPDQACLACHDGAIHHETQVNKPACATCHREHQGRMLLARVHDGNCTDCHRQLQRNDGKDPLFKNVTSFAGDHPEFRLAESGRTDEAKLRFNHKFHMELDLESLKAQGGTGLEKYGSKLECTTCHEPDAERAYMRPINYGRHCQDCHPLTVRLAGRFADADAQKAAELFNRTPAPHEDPATVRAVLRQRLLDLARQHPAVLGPAGAGDQPARALPGRDPATATETEWSWVRGELKGMEGLLFSNRELPVSERLLFRGSAGCSHCHIESAKRDAGSDNLPVYDPTRVPARWYRHSTFRHDSHRMLDCNQCHKAAESSNTTDVLLPGIANCRQCHTGKADGARANCAECHRYHDPLKERGLDGRLTIRECLFK